MLQQRKVGKDASRGHGDDFQPCFKRHPTDTMVHLSHRSDIHLPCCSYKNVPIEHKKTACRHAQARYC